MRFVRMPLTAITNEISGQLLGQPSSPKKTRY